MAMKTVSCHNQRCTLNMVWFGGLNLGAPVKRLGSTSKPDSP
jgi:hypothetical protein